MESKHASIVLTTIFEFSDREHYYTVTYFRSQFQIFISLTLLFCFDSFTSVRYFFVFFSQYFHLVGGAYCI